MSIKINPMDYIDETDLKELCLAEARSYIRHTFTESNIAFHINQFFMTEFLRQNRDIIEEKVAAQVETFEPSIRYHASTEEIIKEVIHANSEAIKEKVQERLDKTLMDGDDYLNWEISNAIIGIIKQLIEKGWQR